jgi:hypothetical protein
VQLFFSKMSLHTHTASKNTKYSDSEETWKIALDIAVHNGMADVVCGLEYYMERVFFAGGNHNYQWVAVRVSVTQANMFSLSHTHTTLCQIIDRFQRSVMGEKLRALVDATWLFSDPVTLRKLNFTGRDVAGEAFVRCLKSQRHHGMGNPSLADMYVLMPIVRRFAGM